MWSVKKIYNISPIEAEFGVSDLVNQVREFLERNVYETANDPQSATKRMVSDATVQAYTSLEIPVPSQDVDNDNAVTNSDSDLKLTRDLPAPVLYWQPTQLPSYFRVHLDLVMTQQDLYLLTLFLWILFSD